MVLLIKTWRQLKAEGSEKQSSQALEFLPLPMLRPKGSSYLSKSSMKPQTFCRPHQTSDCLLRLNPQTVSQLLSVSTSLVLGLKACDPNCRNHLCGSSVSLLDGFSLVYPRVTCNSQRSICLCFLSTGIKDVCHHCLASGDNWWLSSAL